MTDKFAEDTYLTLSKASDEAIYKGKGSKFLAFAYPIGQVEEVEVLIQKLKRKHPKARHWCYAWQMGIEKPSFRYNDDGEPNNSAGKPIYGQILSFSLTNVLIVVVRYFGGTKLGVGGLIVAYRSAARLALEGSKIVEKMIMEDFTIRFDYVHMDKVMRIVKENDLIILNQTMELDCLFKISVRRMKLKQVVNLIQGLRCDIEVKNLN